jgi:uncharacterized protein (TIGR00299 family) protein
MQIGYFDCFSGASGDMILGALVDAGLDVESLRQAIADLGVPGIDLSAEKVKRGPFVGTRVIVRTDEGAHPHRHLTDIEKILEGARIPEAVRADARRIFRRLAEAEAAVHGTTPERIHFHEVGALDAIADIVGAAWGIRHLGLDRVLASPVNLGGGFVQAAHGRIPVPAPGTAALLAGVPAYGSDLNAELTTPTGAAILTTLASGFGPMPPMTVSRVAYGAGLRDLLEQPNLLRLMIGHQDGSPERDQITILEATIDDMNPQFFEPLLDRVFESGALDAFLSPVIMKKSRPGTTLVVLAPPEAAERCAATILTHSTTLGVRSHSATRRKLPRDIITVATPHGAVRVKRGWLDDRLTVMAPEYEDCRRLAHETGIPIHVIYHEARQAAGRIGGAPEERDPAGPTPEAEDPERG